MNDMNIEKLKTAKRIIRSLDKNHKMFHKYPTISNMILSIRVSNDLESFNYYYEAGANVVNCDMYIVCRNKTEMGSNFNKSSIINYINHLIDVTKLHQLLNDYFEEEIENETIDLFGDDGVNGYLVRVNNKNFVFKDSKIDYEIIDNIKNEIDKIGLLNN